MLPILMYHKVENIPAGANRGNCVLPERFDEQLAALTKWGYTFITLEDWLAFRARRRNPPRRPIALTFDDGYRSNYERAWSILRRHGATATVFLVADSVGGTNHWDQGKEPLLDAAEITAMQKGGVLFGSHTCTHRSLVDMKPVEAMLELTRSRMRLEALLGRPVTTLAYPYNKQNRTVRRLAQQAGYEAAVLGRGRVNARWTNPWALMRIRVDSGMSVEVFGRLLEKRRWWGGL